MLKSLRTKWGQWRESRRQYAIERALHKAGSDGSSLQGRAIDNEAKSSIRGNSGVGG